MKGQRATGSGFDTDMLGYGKTIVFQLNLFAKEGFVA